MTGEPVMLDLIERKKRGAELTLDELRWLCREYGRGELPDYQVAAWLMAVCWRGMSSRETEWLTAALVATGETLDWPGDRPVVDKHSTGGVGDKTSIVLVPLLASAGLTFVKMSGRGLGHTGGTLDKLESIPGFRVDLTLGELRRQVERIGCAMVGQNPQLVPADGAIYALRDVTATVDSIPLIASSVMAKKLAAGARAIVLDVKYGAGAFMADIDSARELAAAMVGIGESSGRRVRAVLSSMDEPLGMAVGNALEVREAIETVTGGGPPDLRELTLSLGAHLMVIGGAAASMDDARAALAILLDSGVAAAHLEKLIAAQGGDAAVVGNTSRLPAAPVVMVVESDAEGWVDRVDARGIAAAALTVGAGRLRKGDTVDPRTGVRLLVKSGQSISPAQPIAEIHAGTESAAVAAAAAVRAAVRVSAHARTPEKPASIIIGR